MRPRVEERFQRVTVNARMRCDIDDLAKILYSLETGIPMILDEELTVIKPRASRIISNPSRLIGVPRAQVNTGFVASVRLSRLTHR